MNNRVKYGAKYGVKYGVMALALLPVATWAQLTPSNQQLVEYTYPENVDPEDLSGWLKLEVAVLADSTQATLASEQWPTFPEVRYPVKHRWLKQQAQLDSLQERYPDGKIEVSEAGEITISFEPPPEPEVKPLEDPYGMQMSDAERRAIDPMTGLPYSLDETDGDTSMASSIPLESLGDQPLDADNGVPWLEEFQAQEETANHQALDENGFPIAPETTVEPEVVIQEDIPPPLPESFLQHDLELLEPGLSDLVKSTSDRLLASAAWLQGPGTKNLPILLDRSGDESAWPELQGFVEVRRGSDIRLGINFWLNTQGTYLPPSFAMLNTPPRAPKQIELVIPEGGYRLEDGALVAPVKNPLDDEPPVEFVDPATGLMVTEKVVVAEESFAEQADIWPYRHLIHHAKTETLPERGVRYFDHPVVKVLATYKELTWREVWALGEIEAKARDAMMLEKARREMAKEAGGMLPPDQLPRR